MTRYLHFVDNRSLPARGEDGYHRLQKVLPIITLLKERFLRSHNPHPQNSINEAMIPFEGTISILAIYTYMYTCTYPCICKHTKYKYVVILHFCIQVNKCTLYVPVCVGRSTMKQYMPMKPVKRGFKVWVRADAVNGYFCDSMCMWDGQVMVQRWRQVWESGW